MRELARQGQRDAAARAGRLFDRERDLERAACFGGKWNGAAVARADELDECPRFIGERTPKRPLGPVAVARAAEESGLHRMIGHVTVKRALLRVEEMVLLLVFEVEHAVRSHELEARALAQRR